MKGIKITQRNLSMMHMHVVRTIRNKEETNTNTNNDRIDI